MTPFIVYGGPSSENEVSQSSKDLFLDLLKNQSPILVEWHKDKSFSIKSGPQNISLDKFIVYIKENNGIFVNAMHGEFCEDGWIQEKLEEAQIPFTGPSSESAKLSMDKIKTQELVKDLVQAIPTEIFIINDADVDRSTFITQIKNKFSFPIFIKPNAKGSSVGIYKVKNEDELRDVITTIRPDTYIAQPTITGTELSIGTVCDKGKFLDLPATEILPNSEFFDYKAKYTSDGSEEITPARIIDSQMKNIKRISIKIHSLLKLGCYSRSDFILSNDGELYYLETNSLPGMSRTSLLPQQLRAIGMLDQFGEILLRNANY